MLTTIKRSLAKRLPRAYAWASRIKHGSRLESDDYASRAAREIDIYTDQVEVHDLPEIFHYWSNKYLRPVLEQFGFSNPDDFFVTYLKQSRDEAGARPARFASVGSGNGDTEVRVAQKLRAQGVSDFTIECIDHNPAMLERARGLASDAGVEANIITTQTDFNAWRPDGSYDAIMANQSLHHVLELEKLFSIIKKHLGPAGRFITSDMIGRNGHMRWPEALEIVHEYWRELPEAYRWNVQLKRHEALYENWDCSNESFEGIRAQDILPLLIEYFDFELFIPFSNIIDPFVDRSFGHNFDADKQWDKDFIDRVQARDAQEIQAGRVTPTHLMAVMRIPPFAGQLKHVDKLTPAFCVRRPGTGATA